MEADSPGDGQCHSCLYAANRLSLPLRSGLPACCLHTAFSLVLSHSVRLAWLLASLPAATLLVSIKASLLRRTSRRPAHLPQIHTCGDIGISPLSIFVAWPHPTLPCSGFTVTHIRTIAPLSDLSVGPHYGCGMWFFFGGVVPACHFATLPHAAHLLPRRRRTARTTLLRTRSTCHAHAHHHRHCRALPHTALHLCCHSRKKGHTAHTHLCCTAHPPPHLPTALPTPAFLPRHLSGVYHCEGGGISNMYHGIS